MPKPKSGEWLSTIGVAELLYASPTTIRRWADLGWIPVYRIGLGHGHRRYKREDVEKFMEERRVRQ